MRTGTCCACLFSLTLAGGCGSSTSPPAANNSSNNSSVTSDSSAAAAQTSRSDSPPSFGVLSELLGGVKDRPPLPEGLIPVGDCPPAGPAAAQEVAAQAEALIPLKPGLTMAYGWTRTPREEYECLYQVQSVDNDGINLTLSCDYPERPGIHRRRVCRSDLRNAKLLHTAFGTHKVIGPSGEELPETIVGATALTLSSADFAELKRTGSVKHHYVELTPNGQLEKDGNGVLHIEGRETMRLFLNDRAVDVPVLKLQGNVKYWVRGEWIETTDTMTVLDDERFPLLIDQKASNDTVGSRIYFSKITYPNPDHKGRGASGRGPLPAGGKGLEGRLLENEKVDVYGIYFDFNSDRIREESEPVLNEIGDIMRRHPDWGLNINGHTDNIGGDGAANLDLSRRRSEAVRKALITRFGITADRLSSAGSGASSPKDTNDTPEGRARNRRVELSRR